MKATKHAPESVIGPMWSSEGHTLMIYDRSVSDSDPQTCAQSTLRIVLMSKESVVVTRFVGGPAAFRWDCGEFGLKAGATHVLSE